MGAVRVQTPDARHGELRGRKRGFEIDDVGDDLGRGWRQALLRAHHVATGLVLEPGALGGHGIAPVQLTVALPTAKLIAGITRRHCTSRVRFAKPCGSATAVRSHSRGSALSAPPLRNTP